MSYRVLHPGSQFLRSSNCFYVIADAGIDDDIRIGTGVRH